MLLKNITARYEELLKKHAALDYKIQEYKYIVDYEPVERQQAIERHNQLETLQLHQEHYETLTDMLNLLNLTPLKPTRFVSDLEREDYKNDYEHWLSVYGEAAVSKKYTQPLELY
nr:hypothetical protein [Moritella viscosa]SHO17729.1 Cache domain [Moritella viscosa]